MTLITIHPRAAIDPAAQLGAGVEVGPYSVIGPQVILHDSVKIQSHVVISGETEIGEGTEVFPFAALGGIPQDKKYKGERSRLAIGKRNVIREHVTMNGGTEGGGHLTQVGDGGLFMAGSHVAHDCRIGDNVILANHVTLAGHVTVEDFAILGGLSAVHQWARIGAYAFIGGMSGVENDVIPFGMALGNRAHLAGLNIVGLKRAGFEREQIHTLRKAYRLLFSAEGTLMERLDDVEKMFEAEAAVQRIVSFIRAQSDRAFCVPRNNNG
jgi:UDP-N-acetylglucosamine acyltransferase